MNPYPDNEELAELLPPGDDPADITWERPMPAETLPPVVDTAPRKWVTGQDVPGLQPNRVLPEQPNRRRLILKNASPAALTLLIAPSWQSCITTLGFGLAQGESVTLEHGGAVWVRALSLPTTPILSFIAEYS